MRIRVTLGYSAFLAIALFAAGFFCRSYIQQQAQQSAMSALEADWGATQGYLRLEHQVPVWSYDHRNPDEAYTVERLRHIYLLANEDGNPLEYSTIYDSMGVDAPQAIQSLLREGSPVYLHRKDKDGIPYLILASSTHDSEGRKYFLAIGRSLAIANRTVAAFTQTYLLLSAALLLAAAAFSWWLSGLAAQEEKPL
jgi:hypothetical protein